MEEGRRRLPMTDEQLERLILEDLTEDWPSMTQEEREFYIRKDPRRVEVAGLLLDAPFVKRRRRD